MKLRFQADANLNHNIIWAIRRREPVIDFQTAQAAGLDRVPDLEVLALAAKEGRLLLSHDRKTMPQYFAEFIATRKSSGLLIVPQHLPIATVLEDLLLLWYASEAEEWENRIACLPL